MHANTVFMVLTQLGVGPKNGFSIAKDDDKPWSAFLPEDSLEAAKSYMYIRVRLLFDPPANSFLIEAMERTARELEWRMTIQEGGGNE